MSELCAIIPLTERPPDIVCVNETFLDAAVAETDLEGFDVVGQRDRSYYGTRGNVKASLYLPKLYSPVMSPCL